MSTTYRQFQEDLMPGFLRGPYGLSWARAQGTLKDELVSRTRSSAYLAVVVDPEGRGRQAPDDALPRLGLDTGIDRGPGEAADAWRDRIAGAWESWSWLGTRYGIGYAVSLLGLGTPSVWGWRELPWDGDSTRWARVLVVFRGLPAWDAGAVWDGEDTWDSVRSADADGVESADPDTARAQLRRVLRHWMNARDICGRVLVASGSLLWDLDGVWDDLEVWDEGGGEKLWDATEWDTAEEGAAWDSPFHCWDAFC